MNPLLSGIRVLDLSRLLPGPFCSLYLAQLGAEVIKVEEPNGGDYARSMSPELFAIINRGKKSVTLDLRKAGDADQFRRLAARADAVLESFRPGVMDRLGCGYDTLKQANPRLVYAALTGYGYTGPYRDRAGHDINYRGYAGELDQTGAGGGPPAAGNFQVADLAGGALTCAVGLLAALLGAQKSGKGAFVDAAMLDGTLALQVAPLATARTMGRPLPRGQDFLSGGLPNYVVYECADGRYVSLGALEPKFFAGFCAAAARPDLAKLPLAPGKAGEPLRRELTALFKTRSRDEWVALAGDKDACLGPVLTPEEALKNEQVLARKLVTTVNGKPAFASPLQFLDAAPADLAPAPALGQHNAEVLGNRGQSPISN
jgi:alpha-methylacyl-CoA racemase